MKEKIKSGLFFIFCFYSVIILILLFFTYSNSLNVIDIYDNKDNRIKYSELKKEVKSLDDNMCTDTLNKLLDYYSKTSFNGNVSAKNLYNDITKGVMDGTYFLNYFSDIKKDCNLSDDFLSENFIREKFIIASIQYDEMINKYYYLYELNLKDIYMHMIVDPDFDKYNYLNNRINILEIIDKITSYVKGADSNE